MPSDPASADSTVRDVAAPDSGVPDSGVPDLAVPDLATLDPSAPSHCGRVQQVLDRFPRYEQEHEAFLMEVAEHSPEATLRGQALIAAACVAQDRADFAVAEGRYRRGLAAAWDTGTRSERNGCINYGLMCLNDQRVFEALLLTRRACVLCERGGSAFAAALSYLYLAGVLSEIGDDARADEALARVAMSRQDLNEQDGAYIDRVLAGLHLVAAYRDDDAEGALARLEEIRQAEPMDDPRGLQILGAKARFAAGDVGAALDEIEGSRAVGLTRDSHDFDLDLIEIRCMLGAARTAEAHAATAGLLARLAGEGRSVLSSARRLHVAQQVGRESQALPRGDALSRRAFEIAGAAALERIWEVGAFRRALPHFALVGQEEREILDDYRDRFVREHSELLDVVRMLLSDGDAQLERLPPHHDGAARLVGVCAWCRRLRGPDGLWLDFGDFEALDGAVEVTHGVCEPCHDEQMRHLHA